MCVHFWAIFPKQYRLHAEHTDGYCNPCSKQKAAVK